MMEALEGAHRILLDVDLAPIQGDRFQPTGFADIGPAVYERPDGTRMLLVESCQSMANRLEATSLDGAGPDMAPALDGLPYVRVRLVGAAEASTSSLVEPHRLNSPFIMSNDAFRAEFADRAGYARGKPLDWPRIARALLHVDPNSLIHGVFLAHLGDGRVRVPRAVSGFIEAEDVREAISGGIKAGPIDPTGALRARGLDRDVYGSVPYHRTEFTARRIVAYFNLDLELLRGHGLPREAWEMLVALALWKIRRFLDAGLRLRTACDLAPAGPLRVRAPEGYVLPEREPLLALTRERIGASAAAGLLRVPPVTEIVAETFRRGNGGVPSQDGAGDDE